MTNNEVLWLVAKLPRTVVRDINDEVEAAVEYWSLPLMPKVCLRAVQIVTIEMELINRGALKRLGRTAA
jgi:hypothetical protein